MTPPPGGRPTTTELGSRGERLAAGFLRDSGYRILCTNYRIRRGEIDLIAEDGDVLCFVEVRTRKNNVHGHPFETVGGRKRARLVRAAQHYLASHGCADRWTRFDVVGITYQPELAIELLKGAFDTTSSQCSS